MDDSSNPALREAAVFLNARRTALGDAAVDGALRALGLHEATVAPPRLRAVSVLFVDVVESTRMLQQVAPEDALALVDGAVERFARIVRSHGGEVLRYTGDGLKAGFGVQASREDDAARAVQAGLRILAAAAEHAERVARPLGIEHFGVRVGIHSGTVLLGQGVDADRSAMGHAVHLAARMEQSAPTGRLRISAETWQQVRERFRVEPQAPLRIKGVDEPLLTYLVLGEGAAGEGSPRFGGEGQAVPMVGRDAPLQQLVDAFARVRETRVAASVLLQGEAGQGKTRLRCELHRRLHLPDGAVAPVPGQAPPPLACLRAAAQPTSALQPYGLLRQLLATWLGIADDLPLAQARARLVDGLGAWLRHEARLRAQKVAHLLGFDFGDEPLVAGLGPGALREQACAALTEALHAVAARSPLLLEFEDLHWADAGSLQFVRSLAGPAAVPMLMLLSARPPFAEGVDDAWRTGLATVTLAPLEAGSSQALADALLAPLSTVPATLREALLERSAGNPYFMQQLVRMWIDDGVIDDRHAPWVARLERWDPARIPQTLVGVLQARLDALPAAQLRALQLSSVIGPTFWPAALVELDATAPAALPDLARRGLVVRQPSSAFADAEAYRFEHQVLHDVVYGTVLRLARQQSHARVGRWLASRATGREREVLVAVAEHFERAGESQQAFDHYRRALQHAAERFAHDAQLRLVDRMLALDTDMPPQVRFRLLSSRQGALDRLERTAQSREALEDMQRCADACDSDLLRAEVATAFMLRDDHEGRVDEARRWAEQAIALAGRTDDPAAAGTLARAHGELAWLSILGRDFAAAQRHLDDGLAQASRAAAHASPGGSLQNVEPQLRAIQVIATLAQDRHFEAQQQAAEALASVERLATPLLHDRYIFLEYLTVTRTETGDLERARSSAEQALKCALDIGMPRLQFGAHMKLAEVFLAQGDVAAAAAAIDQADALMRTAPSEHWRPDLLRLRASVAHAQGHVERARQTLDEAIALYVRHGQASEADIARGQLATLELQAARPQRAREIVQEVMHGASPRPWSVIAARALVDCLAVLRADAAPEAEALREHLAARLQAQLAQAPDEAARRRLVEHVPHWARLQGGGVA